MRALYDVPAPAKLTVDYRQHVKPILAAKCFGCHGQKQQQSGLRLDLRQNALRGGDYGAVIVPGNSAESKLIIRLAGSDAGLQMPPTGPLPSEDIGILRAWIDQGAEMPGRADESAEKRRPADPKVELYPIYHDEEWGVPIHDDRRLFEFLILEGAQAGLSWSTVLRKRESKVVFE